MHFKTICTDCDGIISQCRCPSLTKEVKHGMCKKCDEKKAAQEKKNGK